MKGLLKFFLPFSLVLGSNFAFSQSKGSGALGNYTIEVTPTVGIMLPYDFWGIEGTLNTYGIQSAYSVNDTGAITLSALYHSKDGDTGYTVDSGYRHEINSNLFHAYFDVGLHYSNFSLERDYDSEGNCVPANCRVDSGTYFGIYGGTGLVIPLGQSTLARFGFRFYNNPQAWVLLGAGIGFRF